MHGKGAARLANDVDLSPGDRAIAQDADTLVIERMPFAAQIGCLKDREFFFREKVRIHFGNTRIRCEALHF